ncbi:translation initiation factor EIF-2b alpha subunit, putative [Plasmodium reichenowi]|uniref:Translation initiation factor eIF2B subunit alpha n=1 Tax=Plasmodium reichenowi TaxID=5854 RepID=A0A060RX45_PLARE|nr:translation initiation factor EIF-2b alpha subunit, putative [Plasmodium reichenowi]KYN99371.1 translation initiation factor EIF-2b alpha subunit, putative [Plasmodium reichenowi]CDO64052.1 translation initiation factor EIF-2b alpha subunit, putative [Plasmodium reichenowi]SOV78627.1 translation initiation factor EIF-2b alpha subunit, putative [Plasmodium reichenowi]
MECYDNTKQKDLQEEHDVVRNFRRYYFQEKEEMHIAAIKSISDVLKNSISETNFELFINMNEAKCKLNNFINNNQTQQDIISVPHSKRMTIYPIISSCDIYHHFVVKKYTHNENNFHVLKNVIENNADEFSASLQKSLETIGSSSNIMFLNKHTTILTHSNSDCVKSLIMDVVKNQNKQVSIYFTCTSQVNLNYEEKEKKFDENFLEELTKENINITKIDLTQVKDIINKIDFVLIGSEIVTDNGGIINKKGIKLISELCLLYKKPFYVTCQAYKFLKIDKNKCSKDFYTFCTQTVTNNFNNIYEFVSPDFITLFYTDIGIFPPSNISYELSKLYINDAFYF